MSNKSEMNLSKMTKIQLLEVCKQKKIDKVSKLTKNDIIEKLVKSGIKNVTVESKTKKSPPVKKETKPRLEKIDKKLANTITQDKYKSILSELSSDVSDKELVDLIKKNYDEFLETLTMDDYTKYVDTYGAIKLYTEYVKSASALDLTKLSANKIYETLAKFLLSTDESLYAPALKKMRKMLETIHKPSKTSTKKSSKPNKGKKSKKNEDNDEDEEEPDEDVDNEEDEVAEEEEDDNEEEDEVAEEEDDE